MTYDAREDSATAGNPIEFYEFKRSSTIFGYTTAERDTDLNATTFKAAYIERKAVERGTEKNRSKLDILVRGDNPVAKMFRPCTGAAVRMPCIATSAGCRAAPGRRRTRSQT